MHRDTPEKPLHICSTAYRGVTVCGIPLAHRARALCRPVDNAEAIGIPFDIAGHHRIATRNAIDVDRMSILELPVLIDHRVCMVEQEVHRCNPAIAGRENLKLWMAV